LIFVAELPAGIALADGVLIPEGQTKGVKPLPLPAAPPALPAWPPVPVDPPEALPPEPVTPPELVPPVPVTPPEPVVPPEPVAAPPVPLVPPVCPVPPWPVVLPPVPVPLLPPVLPLLPPAHAEKSRSGARPANTRVVREARSEDMAANLSCAQSSGARQVAATRDPEP